MTGCRACDARGPTSAALEHLCPDCLAKAEHAEVARRAHIPSHVAFGLPAEVPKGPGGVRCRFCGNACVIPEGEKGFCGLRENRAGHLRQAGGTPRRGLVQWYFDSLPTNCVASWVCPGSYAFGQRNLAVFYTACSFDCLFCQNWHFREMQQRISPRSARELADAVDERTHCICYFGGDPSVQMPHALAASRAALRENRGRMLRICFETNGNMSERFLEQAVNLALESGGIMKFDLKAFTPALHRALTGVGNERTLESFRAAASRFGERPDVPLVVASTLLVPGYVGAGEVKRIASFITSIDPRIPYSLLAFHPDFRMNDLPTTSRREAEEAATAATGAGVERVNIGNIHLLH